MHLYSYNAVSNHELSPEPIDSFVIRKQDHNSFDCLNPDICFLNG